jgi:hypothetical protein
MKKTLWLFLLLAQIVSGKVVSASYDVSFGVFEKLGKADMSYEINDDKTYAIRVEAYSEGIAKTLSNNRKEVYESYGIIANGRLIPQKYIKTRQNDSKKVVKIYTFDHAKKVVWKENVESIDWIKEENPYYASDDLLSLFFNLQKGKGIDQNGTYYAIGGDKKDGRIDVIAPQGQSLEMIKNKMGKTDGKFLKVIINDSIFSSAKGELLIHLDADKICSKAILEDVLFFGDIVGTRIR